MIGDFEVELLVGPEWFVNPPGSTYGPGVMPNHGFQWITHGVMRWERDADVITAGPGTILFAHPGVHSFFRYDPDAETRVWYLHFRLTDPMVGYDWPASRYMPEGDFMRPLVSHLAWLRTRRPLGWTDLVRHALRLLVMSYVTGSVGASSDRFSRLPSDIGRALTFVRAQWADGGMRSPTLTEIADAAAISPSHLSRRFTSIFGVGPMEVLRLLRLERASMLLRHTNLSVQEVSRATGFGNPYHFSRCFRTLFGAAPRTFRRDTPVRTPVHLARVMELIDPSWLSSEA